MKNKNKIFGISLLLTFSLLIFTSWADDVNNVFKSEEYSFHYMNIDM